MILRPLKQLLFCLATVNSFALSTNTYAKGWSFAENKGENCIILSSVLSEETKNKIANIGILKISSQEIDKVKESERDLYLNGLTFAVETKSSFKTVRVVGAQLTSKSIDTSLTYRENTIPKNQYQIYVSTNEDGLNIVNALMNNEDLTIEFNTPSSGTQYGMVSSKAFKKQYAKFDKCQKLLE